MNTKGIAAVFGVLGFALLALNFLGGTIAGIWLAILGEWWAIGYGIAGIFLSHFVLAIALLPSIGLGAVAGWLEQKNVPAGAWSLGVLSSVYIAAIMTVWCVGILYFFLLRADATSWIPLLIWSYGVATGPWAWMAQKETQSGGGESSLVATFAAQIGYVAMMLAVVFAEPSMVALTVVFGAIMLLATIANIVYAVVTPEPVESLYEVDV